MRAHSLWPRPLRELAPVPTRGTVNAKHAICSFFPGESSVPQPARSLPWHVHELADYATHAIATLGLLVMRVPRDTRADLVHLAETMRRMAIVLDALADEPTECTLRVLARAQGYEETVKREAEGLAGIDSADTLRRLFTQHRERRSPGEARSRGVGFERRDDARRGD